ncbi:MAG: DUF2272 domain-containing protein [Zavarzinia sp.]|nr:DUF2272 domain-containing protein [Zavarzinia sp.]
MRPLAAVAMIVCAALALGACASRTRRPAAARPAPAAATIDAGGIPVPYACGGRQPALMPGGLAAAMIGVARGEWQKWGSRTIDIRPDATVLTLPGRIPAVWEQERDGFPMLAEYWCAVPPYRNYWEQAAKSAGFSDVVADDGGIDDDAFKRQSVGGSPFGEPWSAAFTSWVIHMAGLPESRFRYSDTHWDYVSDALMAAPGTRAFRATGIALAPAAPGDLVCATRSGTPPANWQDLASQGTRPMHCDIVVGYTACGFSPSGRCIEGIGGNVLQAVSLSRIPVDGGGRLVPGLPGQGRDWVVVLKNLGG